MGTCLLGVSNQKLHRKSLLTLLSGRCLLYWALVSGKLIGVCHTVSLPRLLVDYVRYFIYLKRCSVESGFGGHWCSPQEALVRTTH
jgi:hypothetical protein